MDNLEKNLMRYEKTLGTKLYSLSNIRGLSIFYQSLKEKAYSKILNGFKPDKKCSISNFPQFLEAAAEKYNEIIVFAVDSISYEYFQKKVIKKIDPSKGMYTSVLSSVFPTTTAACFMSLVYGVQPSQHAMYGTSFLLEKYNENFIWISNTINKKNLRYTVNDEKIKLNKSKKASVFKRLKEKGFSPYYLGLHGSDNTNIYYNEISDGCHRIDPPRNYRSMKKNPSRLVKYFLTETKKILINRSTTKKIIWNYIDLDDFIHEHMYGSIELKLFWDRLMNFWDMYRKPGRLFVFISDHGQVKQKKQKMNILAESIKNDDLAHNTGGAGRTLFFYPKLQREKQIFTWLQKIFKNNAVILTKDKLISCGLIDKKASAVKRIGHFTVIGQTSSSPSVGNLYQGEHGSLCEEEMYVPILIQLS